MIIHEMEQRSTEWHEIRKGKMTASNAQTIAANGKGLETYIFSILAEKYSTAVEAGYMSADMVRGVELEEQARMTYEMERSPVRTVGFVEMDEYFGCSPDGLVGEDGGIEIKCPNDTNYFRLLVNGEKAIDAKYLWQVQMCMLVAERKWWDLVFYNPNFERNMLVFRQKPDAKMHENLLVGMHSGSRLIKEMETKYLRNNA